MPEWIDLLVFSKDKQRRDQAVFDYKEAIKWARVRLLWVWVRNRICALAIFVAFYSLCSAGFMLLGKKASEFPGNIISAILCLFVVWLFTTHERLNGLTERYRSEERELREDLKSCKRNLSMLRSEFVAKLNEKR